MVRVRRVFYKKHVINKPTCKRWIVHLKYIIIVFFDFFEKSINLQKKLRY